MRIQKDIRIIVLTTTLLLGVFLFTGCPAVEDHPCDGTWEFSQETFDKQGSVSIYVFESQIYSFTGNYYDPATEEILIKVEIYGDGIPVAPLYYNNENGGYWFEYPEETGLSSGADSFTGTLFPETGAASCAFSSFGVNGATVKVESGAFTPGE